MRSRTWSRTAWLAACVGGSAAALLVSTPLRGFDHPTRSLHDGARSGVLPDPDGADLGFGGDGDACNIGAADETGLVDENESVFTDPIFGTYTVTKTVRVCIDPNCGSAGPNGEVDACDPFPDDDRFTYVYSLSNSPKSTNSIIGWVIDTTSPGAIVAAGFIGGPGVAPSEVVVNNLGSRVEWRFFGDPIEPGESSVELYIVSGRGPAVVDSTVEGDFALDTPGLCLGPAVQCEDCNENEVPDACETAPDFDPTPPVDPADHPEDAPFICTDTFYHGDITGAANDTTTFCGLIYGGFHDVFYLYRPKTSGTAVVKVCESDFDPIITIHTGVPATEDNQIACNFQSSVGQNCGAIFEVEAGETYVIRVAGALDSEGEFELEIKGPDCLINPTDPNENGIPDICECLADVNDSGVVDGLDFNQVFFALGSTCDGCPEDINGDGVVDEQDLQLVLLNLGPCPFDGAKAVQGPLGTDGGGSNRLPPDPNNMGNGN